MNASLDIADLRLASLRPWHGKREFVTVLQPCSIDMSYTVDNNKQHHTASLRADHLVMRCVTIPFVCLRVCMYVCVFC